MHHNFKELTVWQEARDLCKEVYVLSQDFDLGERFGLVSQIRRSVVSISANIAEGSGYGSDKQFLRFLHMALGSACETESHVYLALDLGYLSSENAKTVLEHIAKIKKMIRGLQSRLDPNN